MDYAVYQSMTQEYLGTVGIDNGSVIVKSEDVEGDLDVVVADLNAYGIVEGMEHLSRYLDFVEVGTDQVAKETGLEAHGEVSKVDEDRRLVFGWAYVTHDKDGNVNVDKSGEFVDEYDEIEKAAYNFVIKSRAGDGDHTNVKTSEMVESMVFTPEKIEKMGLAPGTLPSGWWVGFRVDDDDLWKSVKEGKRLSFSVHGKGTRKAVDD